MNHHLILHRCITSLVGGKVLNVVAEKRSIPEIEKKIGLLVVNVGTPTGYDYWSVRRFLREFLSDRRVIESPRILWLPILHLFVLTRRPFNLGKLYNFIKSEMGEDETVAIFRSIWNEAQDESPLRSVTRGQATKLASRLRAEPVTVHWAFRYGEPSIASRIRELEKEGCDRLVIFPLFPQFSAVTSASIFDEVCRCLMKQRRQMALSVVPPFYDNELYIKTIMKCINSAMERFRAPPQAIIVSYHGIPLCYESSGDPYGFQCNEKWQNSACDLVTTFQSRFGPKEWLRPYTEDVVIDLARRGVKRIMVIAPGFFSDCVETVVELELQLADSFRKHGGEEYVYVPCLNDSTEGIDILELLSRKHVHCFL